MSEKPTTTRRTDSRTTAPYRLGWRIVSDLLLTAAAFLALFLVWQLWWTDVVALREQTDLLHGLGWAAPPSAVMSADDERRDNPPILPEAAFGEIWGQLYVPRFGTEYVAPIAGGIDRALILDRLGIGHYPGTAMPGDLGNFAIAGHRTTFGRPFHLIADLVEGDPLVVRTERYWYQYRVTHHQIVYPWQVEVVSPVPGYRPGEEMPEPTQRLGSLTACHPMFSARQRWIAFIEFDFWAPIDAGIPRELYSAGVQVIGVSRTTTEGSH